MSLAIVPSEAKGLIVLHFVKLNCLTKQLQRCIVKHNNTDKKNNSWQCERKNGQCVCESVSMQSTCVSLSQADVGSAGRGYSECVCVLLGI